MVVQDEEKKIKGIENKATKEVKDNELNGTEREDSNFKENEAKKETENVEINKIKSKAKNADISKVNNKIENTEMNKIKGKVESTEIKNNKKTKKRMKKVEFNKINNKAENIENRKNNKNMKDAGKSKNNRNIKGTKESENNKKGKDTEKSKNNGNMKVEGESKNKKNAEDTEEIKNNKNTKDAEESKNNKNEEGAGENKNNKNIENTRESKIDKNVVNDLQKKDNKLEVKKTKQKNENKKNILLYIGIILGILLLILAMLFIGFIIRNYMKNDVISNGVYIYGIDVSNMSKAEAMTVLSQTFEEILDQNIVLISDEDYETYIEPSEIDLEYDIASAVDSAYQIGKNGNLFTDNYEILNTMINKIDITPTYSIDEEKLATILEGLSADLPTAVVEGSYYIEDTTLVITKGTDGYIVNVEETVEKIKESVESFDYLENSITLALTEQSPADIDLDAIYEEVYQEATDAYYTTDPYAVYPSSTGLDFSISLDEAKELLEEAESECEIALKVLYPSVTTNDIEGDAFPDLLASYTTKYDISNTNRVTNLKLAASKIDGTVLLSGDTFSYNQVVGERTIAAGYKEAGIYVNGEVTNGLGGGICQISTTLFNAALLANLEMIEVHNHQMIPSYSSAGRDATVVYGTKDFQFSNSRNYAIKIECSVSGGVVSFKIYGVKEDTEYDVSISAKITSQTSSYIKSQTYRILKLNGETVSTEFIYSCTYKVSD